MTLLAVVLPAFKARFLDAALASIAAQTVRDFVLYVGDDASPDELAPICARWAGRIDLRYTRFEHNLGARDLAAQWQRCVALCSEPWVWLFSDDDVMPPDGVARLLAAIRDEGAAFELFHFDVDRLDAEGRVVRREPAFPPLLSVREFARRRLRFELASFAPDYVFSRAAFERAGGFVPFARAWGSDDATWMTLAARGGIRTIAGTRVGWRDSGANISSQHGADRLAKTWAQIEFLQWLDRFLLEHPAAAGEPPDAEVLRWARPWFFRQAKTMKLRFLPAHAAPMSRALSQVRGLSRLRVLLAMLRSDARRWIVDTRAAWRGR